MGTMLLDRTLQSIVLANRDTGAAGQRASDAHDVAGLE
jgi:hypothetical protein